MSATFRIAGAHYDSAGSTITTTPSQTVPTGVVATDIGFVLMAWVDSSGGAAPTPSYTTVSGSGVGTLRSSTTGTLTSNMGFALFSVTGAVAGDTFTTGLNIGKFVTLIHAWYSGSTGIDTVGSLTGRNGTSSSTTTAAAVSCAQGSETVVIFSVERTTATGTTVSMSTGTKEDFYEGTSSSTCSCMIGDDTGPGSPGSAGSWTMTYSSASGNGFALAIPLLSANVSSTITATSTVSGTIVGSVNSTITATNTVTASVNAGGAVSSTITATATVTANTNSPANVTSTITATNNVSAVVFALGAGATITATTTITGTVTYPTTDGISTYAANSFLNVLRNVTFTGITTVYVQLHTGSPGPLGTSNISALTTRNAITWLTPSAGSMLLNSVPLFVMTTSELITDISLWDASTSGNYLWSAPLSSRTTVINGSVLWFTTFTVSILTIAG